MARAKICGIELKWEAEIEKVRRGRQGEFDVTLRENAQDFLVANIFARFDVARGEAERKPPGKERLAFANAENGEAVSLQDGMGELEDELTDDKASSGRECANGDGDIVAVRRMVLRKGRP
jgi:hypothetical protein